MSETETRPPTPKEIFDGLKEQLEALRHDSLSDVDTASHFADLACEGFHSIEEELQEKRDRLRTLQAEHEALPQQAFRASMDADPMREQELRGRYAEVREELPKLEKRVRELEAESLHLCPPEYRAAPAHGVEIAQHGPASRKAGQHREEAEKLASDIRSLLDEFVEPIQKRDRSIKEFLRQHSEMMDRVRRGEL